MRLQSTQASCGPACLRNALLCYGIIRSEQEIEGLAGTTGANGTSGPGLQKAISAVAGEHPQLINARLSEVRADVAILKLLAALHDGHVVILCVDEYEHWVLAFGVLGGGARILVHVSDPADNEMIVHMKPAELLARWKGPEKKPFYGIIV